jgi:hypothetical protein
VPWYGDDFDKWCIQLIAHRGPQRHDFSASPETKIMPGTVLWRPASRSGFSSMRLSGNAKPRPEVRAGRRGGFGLVSVLPAGAGPDDSVSVAFLVVEHVGIIRRVEGWIVQLDREVAAVLGAALGSGDSALGAADMAVRTCSRIQDDPTTQPKFDGTRPNDPSRSAIVFMTASG